MFDRPPAITHAAAVEFKNQLPDDEQPQGVPIACLRVEPLGDPEVGLTFPGTTCPVFVQDRQIGTMLISQFEYYGYSEVSCWLQGVARSDLRRDAFISWGDYTRGHLKMDGETPTSIHLTVGTGLELYVAHRAAIDPHQRGPLDADGLQHWLEPALLKDLPFPTRMDEPDCMAYQYTQARRALRRFFPRRISDCCDFHRVDWRQASAIALEIQREAYTIPDWDEETINDFRRARLQELFPGTGKRHDLKHAVSSLLSTGLGVIPSYPGPGHADSYVNGRHRVQVMLDQGVRRTVIGRSAFGELIASTP